MALHGSLCVGCNAAAVSPKGKSYQTIREKGKSLELNGGRMSDG